MKELLKLKAIFSPQHVKRYQPIIDGNKVAHYTTAEIALSIIENREIWLRNTIYMNDYSEITHGHNQMLNFFNNDPARNKDFDTLQGFMNAIESVDPDLLGLATKYFDENFPIARLNTYCCCFSQHDSMTDRDGKLSMWRGYGKAQPAVALIINANVFLQSTDDYGAYALPVVYGDQDNFVSNMQETTEAIIRESQWLRTLDINWVGRGLLNSLTANAVARKHPGFVEEQEWRIYHIDKTPLHSRGMLKKDTVSISGRPQFVMKAPLRDLKAHKIYGTDLNQLIHSVIIGPTEYPFQQREIFIKKLAESGVEDAHERVTLSSIPWRGG